MTTESSKAPIVPADKMTAAATLPTDWQEATLIGRVMTKEGPSVVFVRDDGNVIDISNTYATTTDLFEQENPAGAARRAAFSGKVIGKVNDIVANSSVRDPNKPYLLSPADFQAIEAAGVTFVESMVERMVEAAVVKEVPTNEIGERDPDQLRAVRTRVRKEIADIVGTDDFSKIEPGSEGALTILDRIKELGMPTEYAVVGLGKEGEIFAKADQNMSVGHGAQAGYSKGSAPWVNPEPEVMIFANSKGKSVGATHCNDVNDRKKEGESPLKLHRAKVKKGSAAIGPFIRLFDESFSMRDVEQLDIKLEVTRADGSVKFAGTNSMKKISRSPDSIIAAACDDERYHPQGVCVALGTMVVPGEETDKNGEATLGADGKPVIFTHHPGDVSRFGSDKLGYLANVMLPADKVQGLEKGTLDLACNLAGRGLIGGQAQVAAASVAGRR